MDYLISAQFANTIGTVFFAIVVFALSRYIRVKYIDQQKSNEWKQTIAIAYECVTALLMVIFAFIVLSINGVDIGKTITNLGLLGVILSFSLQDVLKDLIMGITISMDDYFKVGDVVNYKGNAAKVMSFNLKTTRLFIIGTSETLSVGNRNISEIGLVSDFTDINIPVGYDIDLNFGRDLCREAAKRIERLRYVYSADFLNTSELGESWIEYRVRIYCLPEKKGSVKRNALAVVQDVFYERGVPFPLGIKVVYQGDMHAAPLTAADCKPNAAAPAAKPKISYEFGRGASSSKTMDFDGTDNSLMKAVDEAARYATSENLSKKMQFQIRLLSEEMLTLVKEMDSIKDSTFCVERQNSNYELVFHANASVSRDEKGQLIAVASSGKNDAYTGIGGLIRHAMDSMVSLSLGGSKGSNGSEPSPMDSSIGKTEDGLRWSYKIYKEQKQTESLLSEEDIDQSEISKSVLVNLSDDIKISIRSNRFTIRVLVKSDDVD